MPPNIFPSGQSIQNLQSELEQLEQVQQSVPIDGTEVLEVLKKSQLISKKQLTKHIECMKKLANALKRQSALQKEEQLNQLNIRLKQGLKLYSRMKETSPEAQHRRLTELIDQDPFELFLLEFDRQMAEQVQIYRELRLQKEVLENLINNQRKYYNMKALEFLKNIFLLALIFCLFSLFVFHCAGKPFYQYDLIVNKTTTIKSISIRFNYPEIDDFLLEMERLAVSKVRTKRKLVLAIKRFNIMDDYIGTVIYQKVRFENSTGGLTIYARESSPIDRHESELLMHNNRQLNIVEEVLVSKLEKVENLNDNEKKFSIVFIILLVIRIIVTTKIIVKTIILSKEFARETIQIAQLLNSLSMLN